jgi:hypothetical protein
VKIQFYPKPPTISTIFAIGGRPLPKPIKLYDSALWAQQKYFLFFAAATIANMKKGTTFATLFERKTTF